MAYMTITENSPCAEAINESSEQHLRQRRSLHHALHLAFSESTSSLSAVTESFGSNIRGLTLLRSAPSCWDRIGPISGHPEPVNFAPGTVYYYCVCVYVSY